MMEDSNSSWGTGIVGTIIVLFLLFFAFSGNGGLFGRGNNNGQPVAATAGLAALDAALINGGCSKTSCCEVEKQEIIDSARTQYLIETKNAESTAQILAAMNNQYMDTLNRALSDEKMENAILKGEIGSMKNYFGLSQQISGLAAQTSLGFCNTVQRPPFIPYGGTACAFPPLPFKWDGGSSSAAS